MYGLFNKGYKKNNYNRKCIFRYFGSKCVYDIVDDRGILLYWDN